MKKELVENIIDKLINHIDTKSANAASPQDCDDTCFGMEFGRDEWKTENELRNSIKEMFSITFKKEEEDDV